MARPQPNPSAAIREEIARLREAVGQLSQAVNQGIASAHTLAMATHGQVEAARLQAEAAHGHAAALRRELTELAEWLRRPAPGMVPVGEIEATPAQREALDALNVKAMAVVKTHTPAPAGSREED